MPHSFNFLYTSDFAMPQYMKLDKITQHLEGKGNSSEDNFRLALQNSIFVILFNEALFVSFLSDYV